MAELDLRGYIYIVHLREHVNHDEPIYKVGRTGDLVQRMREYPTGSAKLFSMQVHDQVLVETRMLAELRNTMFLRHRCDIGAEYFEGSFENLLRIVLKHVWPSVPFVPLSFKKVKALPHAAPARQLVHAHQPEAVSTADATTRAESSDNTSHATSAAAPVEAQNIDRDAMITSRCDAPTSRTTIPVTPAEAARDTEPDAVVTARDPTKEPPQSHRHYMLRANNMMPEACAALREASAWPAYLRYAACSITPQGTFQAYAEFGRPVRPCVFAKMHQQHGILLDERIQQSRESRRHAVLDASGVLASWELGSWEAGRTGVHKQPVMVSLLASVVASQQQAIEALQRGRQ